MHKPLESKLIRIAAHHFVIKQKIEKLKISILAYTENGTIYFFD